jgi:hypothetical protein
MVVRLLHFQHIVKKCEVKSDLEVLHCITSGLPATRCHCRNRAHDLLAIDVGLADEAS